jgi:hypothetical protein
MNKILTCNHMVVVPVSRLKEGWHYCPECKELKHVSG